MHVYELFNLNKDFKNIEIIAGKNGLNNVIKNIEVLEVPDGVFWTKEGDFMVTTGYFLKKNESTFENLINMLAYHKAAGLGIKVGRFLDEIPEKILQLADAHSLPIINIPIHMRYSSILLPVATKLINNESYDNFIIKKYKKELAITIQNNYHISAITNLLSLYIGHSIYAFWQNNYKLINDTSEIEASHVSNILKENAQKIYSSKQFTILKTEKDLFNVFKLKGVNEILAYLCIHLKSFQTLADTDIKIIEETLPFISIYLLSHSKVNLTYYKSIDEFFYNIINGNFNKNELKLKEEAAYLNIEYSLNRYIWVLEFSVMDKKERDHLLKTIISFLESHGKDFLYQREHRRFIFICALEQSQTNLRLFEGFFKELLIQLNFSFKGRSFKIATSKSCKSLKHLNFAYEEAIFALKLGNKLHNHNSIYYYDDFMIYNLLYEISSHPTLSKLYRNTIERLKKYDNTNNTNLLNTIEALIKYDFNIGQTSSNLYIHRNTLYKRLNKISSLLDFDIDKSENRLILQLAIKLNKILD